MDNGENGGHRSNKFKESIAKRFKKNYNTEPIRDLSHEKCGPLYPVGDESFVLKSCKDNGESSWNPDDNQDGIVPIVVNPKLVNGKHADASLPLSEDQRLGIQFLWDCVEKGEGGILAHDVGLGKTRTTITLIGTLLQQSSGSKGKSRPGLEKCIIIAPKNGVSVWEEEFNKWMPEDIPYKIEVLRPGQRDGWDVVNRFGTQISHTNILILSYDTFLKYNSKYKSDGFQKYARNSIKFVICDEAHVLKTEDTIRVKNLRTFEGTDLWLGITATPYQNNVMEFCNLFRYFRRGSDLDNLDCRKKIAGTIQKQLEKHKRLVTDEAKDLLGELRDITVPAIHYRGNSLNKEKHEVTLCVPLDGHPDYYSEEEQENALQHKLYDGLIPCLTEIRGFEKLSYLHKACIHPSVLKEAMDDKPHVFQRLLDLYDSVWQPEDLEDPNIKKLLPDYSAKIKVVTKMAVFLKDKFPEEKMVIVSASVVLLKLLKGFLDDHHRIKTVMYDGGKSEVERHRCLEDFANDNGAQFLLLSLKAGGTALTLTRANHLVLMDPDYNPANDRQALGRIYRPTQERPVFVYRLLATGTIEEHKFVLQLGKEEMDKFFRADGQPFVQAPFREADLLAYHPKTRSHIRDLLDKVDIENFNSGEEAEMDRTFAEELKNANQYTEIFQVPKNLPLVKEIWNHVSYAFHIPKISLDEVGKALFQ